MTIPYTQIARQLPENRMRMSPTKGSNTTDGLGCNKSLFTAVIIRHLNRHHKTVGQIRDFAKSLVWQKGYEALKNQYHIAPATLAT